MYAESDTSSGFIKGGSGSDIIGVTSEPAHNCHNTLLSTMKILQNKDETLRVQSESLDVAETRIAELTHRNNQLKIQLDEKIHELSCLRHNSADNTLSCQTMPEMVKSLREHISVIEELYRESFFESAKQEQVIDVLRKSNLDVRIMEKQKASEIVKLQDVVMLQQTSLNRCKEIADEVENLKGEIWNFLNNSNNDSGVWEESEESVANDVHDDLHDIMHQLAQLRDILIDDCTCDERLALQEKNDNLQAQINDLNVKMQRWENIVKQKDNRIKQLNLEIKQKNKQVGCVCESTLTIQQTNDALQDKIEDLNRKIDNLENVILQKEILINKIKDEKLTNNQERCTIADNCAALKERNDILQVQVKDLHSQLNELENDLSQREDQIKQLNGQIVKNDKQIHSLKEITHESQVQIQDLNRKILKLEDIVSQREKQIKQLNVQLHQKNEELVAAEKHIDELDEGLKTSQRLISQQRHITETLQTQLNERQATIIEQSTDLESAQCVCRAREQIIQQLKDKLNYIEEEKHKSQSELSAQVSILRSKVIDLGERERDTTNALTTLQLHYKQLQDSYKEKDSTAAYLEKELHSSTERGAQLCVESRRVLAVLRSWISNVRNTHRKQALKIRERDRMIRFLRQKLGYDDTSASDLEDMSNINKCKCIHIEKRGDVTSNSAREREMPCSSRATREGQNIRLSERVKDKKHAQVRRGNKRKHSVPRVNSKCMWGVRCPNAESTPEPPMFCLDDYFAMDDITPTEELQSRVLRLQDALAEGQRRWTKHCHR